MKQRIPSIPLAAPGSATSGSSVNATNATSVATGPCTGVVIDYAVNTVSMIPPVADPQPFRFEATATMQNIGSKTLKVGGFRVLGFEGRAHQPISLGFAAKY